MRSPLLVRCAVWMCLVMGAATLNACIAWDVKQAVEDMDDEMHRGGR